MTKGKELSFHRLQNNVSSSAKQCLLSVNLKPFLVQTEQQTQDAELSILPGEDLTPKNPLERERRLEIQRPKQQRWRRHQQTAEQREHHSMNFEC